MADRKNNPMNSGERLLIELNLSVKYLTDAFEKFQKASADNYSRIESAKLDRSEFNLLKLEADKVHVSLIGRLDKHETGLETIQTNYDTLSGQIRLGGWLIGVGMIILGIVAPILTAIYIK